jgi:hypothetical protein
LSVKKYHYKALVSCGQNSILIALNLFHIKRFTTNNNKQQRTIHSIV